MDEHQEMIWRICRGYLGDQDDQKDLFQEIMINIWKNLKSFKGKSKTSTWIYRVAVNSALMYLRSNKKLDKEKEAWEENQYHSNNIGPSTEDNLTLLYTCIHQLEEVDRIIIILTLEGEKYQSIAKHLGISASNVGVKINRIKSKLQKMMQEAHTSTTNEKV